MPERIPTIFYRRGSTENLGGLLIRAKWTERESSKLLGSRMINPSFSEKLVVGFFH